MSRKNKFGSHLPDIGSRKCFINMYSITQTLTKDSNTALSLWLCLCMTHLTKKCNDILKQAKRITCRNIFLIFFYFVSNIYMFFSFYLRRIQYIFDIFNLSVSVLISFNIPLPKKKHTQKEH